jgi:SNF2 family DNA or RNA helicase
MKLLFNQDKTRVNFVHETPAEYTFLMDFPAFLKGVRDPHHWAPADPPVLFNLYHRLKKAKRTLRIEPGVMDLINMPFALKKIPESFKYHTSPMPYQDIALRYLYTVGSGGLLLDPGMGKSKVVLDYIWLKQFKRVLIVCPKPLLFVWEDEIGTHRPELTFHVVKTTDWQKEKEGILANNVTIINYNKAVLFKDVLKSLGFEFIHLDEFLIKDPKTDRTKGLTELGYHIPYHAGGSGTLINNTIRDVFAPVRFLNPVLVGKSGTNFMNHFAVMKKDPNSGQQRVVNFKYKDEARSILESCCIVMTKDEWLDLPEKVFHDIYVPMTDEQRRLSQELASNYLAEFQGREIEIDNPLVMLSKLYQISNGFIYYTPKNENEKDNEVEELLPGGDVKAKGSRKKIKRETLYFENSAKITALRNLINEKIPDRKALIWFNMEAEYALIKEMLEKEGKTFLTIKGGEKDTGAKVRTFNKSPNIQYLVCQAKSVNYGITVLGKSLEDLEDSEEDFEMLPGVNPEVHTEIFYSMNFSLEVYLQQQDRIHRLGQKHQCDYYRIFAISAVEKRIRDAISEKLVLRREMLVDIAEKLRKDEGDELV